MSCATLYTDLMTPSFTPSGISYVMNGRASSIKAIQAKGSCPMAIVWVGDRRCHLMKCNDLPVPLLKSEKPTNNWLKGRGDVLAEETFHDRQDQAVIYVKRRRQRPRDATKHSRAAPLRSLVKTRYMILLIRHRRMDFGHKPKRTRPMSLPFLKHSGS